MYRNLAAAVALVALFGVPAGAQNAPQDAMAVIRAADAAIGASKTRSIRYGGADGYITAIGQSETSSVQHSWPRFNLKSFTRTIDYDTMSMREEKVLTQGAWPAERGGGLRPIVGERRSVAMFRDGYAWDVNADGSTTPRPQDATVRRLEILMTPHGFIRAALKAKDLHMEVFNEGNRNTRKTRAISFKYMDKYPLAGWIDDNNNVTKVQTWFPSPVVGDQFVETRYAQYKDYNGFRFGPEVHQSVGIPPDPSYDFSATDVAINVPNAVVEIPANVRQAGDTSGVVQTRQLAPGVWLSGANGYNSVIVEFADFVTVIEAPLNEQRSIAVMNEVRRLMPNKAIRYVVNTHHHYDHAGGLRGYGAEDAFIVTSQTNYDYYEALGLALHPVQLEPDRLARFPRQVHYVRVQEHHTIADSAGKKMEIYHVQDQEHSEDMLMAYLPAEKILVEADLFEAGQTAPTERSMALLYNIQRVSIEPTRIVSIHSGEIPIADFLRAVGQPKLVAQGEGLDAALNDSRP
jgi:glyoxylase-like metal-dependent hydrolase (beta-lactamase superfamily II)